MVDADTYMKLESQFETVELPNVELWVVFDGSEMSDGFLKESDAEDFCEALLDKDPDGGYEVHRFLDLYQDLVG